MVLTGKTLEIVNACKALDDLNRETPGEFNKRVEQKTKEIFTQEIINEITKNFLDQLETLL